MDLSGFADKDWIKSYDDPEQLVKFIEKLTLTPAIHSPPDALDIVVRSTKPFFEHKQNRKMVKFVTKVNQPAIILQKPEDVAYKAQ